MDAGELHYSGLEPLTFTASSSQLSRNGAASWYVATLQLCLSWLRRQ
jgi:hypothetical protein